MQKDVTQLLNDWQAGDPRAADVLLPLIYEELRRLARSYMRRERANHTLQGTALVNEAYVKLLGQNVSWQNRAHFFGIAAQEMRRILIDYARKHTATKRASGMKLSLDEGAADFSGGDEDQRLPLRDLIPELGVFAEGTPVDEARRLVFREQEERLGNLLILNEALVELGALDALQAKIVELRYFGGMTVDEVAECLKISSATVERKWTMAKAWLKKEIKSKI